MKKKFVTGLIIMMAAAFSVSGCGLKDSLNGGSDKQTEDSKDKADKKDKDSSEKNTDEAEDDNEKDADPVPKSMAYFYANDLQGIFYVSEEGVVKDYKNLEDIFEVGYIAETSDKEAFGMNWTENGTEVFCYDFESGNHYIFDTNDVNMIHYYNGRVYLTKTNSNYDDAEEKYHISYDEYIYEKDELGKYVLADTKIDMLGGFEYGGIQFLNGSTFYNTESIDCSLEKYGNVIIEVDEGIYGIADETGVLETFELSDSGSVSLICRTKDYILFREYNYDDLSDNMVYSYDLNTGDTIDVTDSYEMMFIPDKNSNTVYFAENASDEFGIQSYNTYMLNLDTSDKYLIGKYDTPAGYSSVACGVSGFSVIDGRLFFANINDDKSISLHTAEFNEGDFKEADTGYALSSLTPDFNEYGEIEYYTYTQICDECNKPCDKFYCEYFVLDDRFGCADKINIYLYNEATQRYNDAMEQENSMDVTEDDYCDFHAADYMVPYYEQTVTNVSMIGNHYIQIDCPSYWFGGGAHGMPAYDFKLFDFSNGERVKLSDVYSGTDEELTEVLYQKVKEKYDEEPEIFFEYSDDELREIVSRDFNVDVENIEYTNEGIYFHFMPYELGPFASGFISVFVTFDELGIEAFFN